MVSIIQLLPVIRLIHALIGYREEKKVIKPAPPELVVDEDYIYDGGELPTITVTSTRLYINEWMQAARHAWHGAQRIEEEQVKYLLKAWEMYGTGDERHLAYIFASIWHECHFEPKNERRANPLRQPTLYRQQEEYWHTGYYGRGPIQITWETNYQRFGRFLGLPLLKKPQLVNDPKIGYTIAVVGMVRGWFTGAPLEWFLNDSRSDWYKARRTVNGDEHVNGRSIANNATNILKYFITFKNQRNAPMA